MSQTLTVGIPAHNEEGSIGGLLRALLAQRERGFKLEKILILCDGCTDSTYSIAKDIAKNEKRISIIDDGKRKGKTSRVNQILRSNKSDILLLLDADIIVPGNDLLENICKAFSSEHGIGLVGGNSKPFGKGGYFEAVVVNWVNLWQEMARPINNWCNPNNNHGCITALSNKFAHDLVIPEDTIAEDHYIFFEAMRRKFKFRFSKKSIIYFKVPSKLGDYINQSKRYGKSGKDVRTQFLKLSPELTSIPFRKKIEIYGKYLVKFPVKTILGIVIQILIMLSLKLHIEAFKNGIFETVKSSKVKFHA